MATFFDKETKQLVEFFKKFPKEAGIQYLNHFLDSFKNQGFTDKKLSKWKARAKSSKKKKKRGILVKTGRLQRSLKLKVTGARIVISTATPYAEIHNEGGIITGTAKVPKHRRKGYNVKAHKRKGSKVKRHKRKASTIGAHTRKMNTKIPKRQFMGKSDKMDAELAKIIEKEFSRIFK